MKTKTFTGYGSRGFVKKSQCQKKHLKYYQNMKMYSLKN